jgi:hypothetical protein
MRKYVEGIADRNVLKNLKEDELQVICDYKMKILAGFYKEPMSKFFAKRGTICLGFMLKWLSGEKDKINVNFHFLLSDDTTQETYTVLAAKQFIYSQCIPKTDLSSNTPLTKVNFQYDGAGCFSSNPHKVATIEWKDWTGVIEVSSRQSINGGGNTPVDGTFGQITHHLKRANNAGKCYSCAQSILSAVHGTGGMNGCTFHVFKPVRNQDLDTTVDFLRNSQNLKYKQTEI